MYWFKVILNSAYLRALLIMVCGLTIQYLFAIIIYYVSNLYINVT